MTSNSEKKDKSLAEFVLIIVLVGIMMAIFIKLYNKNESQFRQAGFASIAQTFTTKVNVVHAQWMMDNQPSTVYLASLNNETKQSITVNEAGWIDVTTSVLPCQAIWQLVMQVPITAMKLSISAIAVHTGKEPQRSEFSAEQLALNKGLCRYVLVDGSYFQYNRVNGKVSKLSNTD
ncbi:hypothetical protein [Colwellia ponticola]|uniref:Type II secretion system protein n=1 Tax=Colwellia ponticola TaxID=2304625 RepID=A0A8H2PLY6_9GAMM|nr:hypothetical protein [Colwellia ponticola]TMM47834.1 hypothetical protein FCS21_02385 [Colwellia ponticola]